MYNNYFGFVERPFQLVPNPDYLFLGASHEEALAHLTYSISQGDGFVEITGEVGAGKTTLCRVLLESLDADTEAAFIFNPKLDSIQLLKAINDEFGISSEADNTKELIDTLNFFLLRKKSQGRKVVLLIDEAQNLNNEVLEQIRLLSNLETTTSKLLQIILVGQPELSEKLDSYELRQLGQRITLSYHIAPLKYPETKAYIQHRLQIAAKKPNVEFTRSAYKLIHRYAGGIPRLINIACDRALLTAYGLNQKVISGVIVRSAIKELSSRGDIRRESQLILSDRMPLYLLLLVFACVFTALVFYYLHPLPQGFPLLSQIFKPATESQPAPDLKTAPLPQIVAPQSPPAPKEDKAVEAKASMADDKPAAPAAALSSALSLRDYILSTDLETSKQSVLEAIVGIWNEKGTFPSPDPGARKDALSFFSAGLEPYGLLLHPLRGNIKQIENINMPAILELVIPEKDKNAYIALKTAASGKYQLVAAPDTVIEVELTELQRYFFNRAHLVWKNFYAIEGTIPREISPKSILSLKTLLVEIGFSEISMTPEYDERTRKVIETIQEKNGIKKDGVVGPLTKIVLYKEKASLSVPRLSMP